MGQCQSCTSNSIDRKFKKAIQTQNESLIQQLVDEHTGLLDTIFPDGNGVVHIAVKQQNTNLTRYFLASGVSPNQKNCKNGDTPLHIASRLRNLEIVSLLTEEYAADPSITNNKDETSLTIASKANTSRHDTPLLGDHDLIVEALSRAANTSITDEAVDTFDLKKTRTLDLLEAARKSAHAQGLDKSNAKAIFSLSEVAEHKSIENGIWIVINDMVYDITSFIKDSLHPATNAFIQPYYGLDATDAFEATFHSIDAVRQLNKYEIGRVKASDIKQKPSGVQRKLSQQISLSHVASVDVNTGESLRSKIGVSRLFIFPVKGMKGISVQKAKLTLSGFADDRIYAVVNKATNKAVNQLTYTSLSRIVVAFKDGTDNCDAGIQLNDQFVPFVQDKTMNVEWKSCTTKILVYDQGEAVSKWITSFMNEDGGDDEFIFVRIHEENYRESEDYFALPFTPKSTQRMSAFQNYAPVNLASEESMKELNRRYSEREHGSEDEKRVGWDRFRENIVICGVLMPHHEDFMKHITFGDKKEENESACAELLWSRRRYFCAMPQVNQSNSCSTMEPIATARSYRNAITLNDRTALPGDDAVFFGSFYCVKDEGIISVGQKVISEHERLEYDVRTQHGKSYFGLSDDTNGSALEINYLRQYSAFELLSREQYNHDTIKVRFGLVVEQKHIKAYAKFRKSLKEILKMGDHYLLKYVTEDDTPIIRAYTPLFDDDNGERKELNAATYDDNDWEWTKLRSFVLLVKVYPDGRMTQHMNRMKIGDQILCKQSTGKVCYFEIGKIRFGDPRMTMNLPYNLNVNRFNLIAGGSGITPMYQIISSIHLNKEFDDTKISFIFANKTEKDILLRDKLEEIANTNENIKVHYVISRPETKNENENGFDVGRLNLNICKKYLFPPSNADDLNVVTLLCGPHPMVLAVKQCLTQIGYDDKSVATF
eukprot:569052_1